MKALVSSYDAALFDLDGVVYLGPNAIDGVTSALARLREIGTRLGFVTNNAARTPAAVAEHLRELGIQADDSDVVNSTQATVRMLRGELLVGAKVLRSAPTRSPPSSPRAVSVPVSTLEENPVAVVQGYHPQLPWSLLELGAIAVQRERRGSPRTSTRPARPSAESRRAAARRST